jgi:hypothetical protein
VGARTSLLTCECSGEEEEEKEQRGGKAATPTAASAGAAHMETRSRPYVRACPLTTPRAPGSQKTTTEDSAAS